MHIDVLVVSVSRPDLLKETVESFFSMIKYEKHELRLLFHEDYLIYEESDKCMDYIKSTGKFNVIEYHKPNIMLGPVFEYMFKHHVKADLCFVILDDHSFVRPIDLDRIVDVFQTHHKVNNVAFCKYPVHGPNDKPVHRTFKFALPDATVVEMTTTYHWMFSNSVWRMGFIRKYMDYAPYYTHWATNRKLKAELGLKRKGDSTTKFIVPGPEWAYEKQGTYFYGAIGEGPYIKHIGNLRPHSIVVGEARGEIPKEVEEYIQSVKKRIKNQ